MLTDEKMKRHKKVKRCEFCNVKFDKENRRIQHHNHINGIYIATVCKSCNSKMKTNNCLYIVFHYMKGYDIHYIIKTINVHFKDSNINLIGHNASSIFHIGIQNYIKIIDFHEFITASLKDLSSNLKIEDINYTRKMLEKYGHEFLKKDIFPFRYIDSFEKYNKKTFPHIEYFDNIDQMTYEKYRKFYYTNFNSLGEYSDYYLEKDVRLICDVMEKYRKNFMEKEYKTELFSHYSINSLTWEMLKKWNPVQIKLLDNYKIYTAFQSMMRGGLCGIANRYAIANNKYMKNYDPNQSSSYIMHYDIDAMYAHIMRTYKLPYDDFTFLSNDQIRDFNIWDYDENSEYGYILNIDISEIDISYHDYYNDLPIFCMKRKIFKKELSEYQKEILDQNNKLFISTEKLLLDFHSKKEYTVHYLTLQFYLKLGGFKIQNINYIIRFRQAGYMKDYIEYNHKIRIESDNKNDKMMYKLLNNSVFGRCLLNKERYSNNIKIISDYEKASKAVSNNRFKDYEIINEESALFNIEKQCIKLDSPNYIGSTILDLSKIIFYNYWYKLKNRYKDNISLIYYDTDSFLCHIQTDVYKDMTQMNISDMSCYDPNFKYHKKGKYEMGLLKDESPMTPIVEAVSLKDKLYGY